MTTPWTIERQIHFDRRGRGRKELQSGPEPPRPPTLGRVPRVSRWMALAVRLDQLMREGVVTGQAELARLGHVTRARVSQIMNLLNLAPNIQEAILFLPRTERGRDPVLLWQLQRIAAVADWQKQRRMWSKLTYPRAAWGGGSRQPPHDALPDC